MSKAIKTIILTAQASDAHNSVKCKNVLKWLKSGHEVRVSITGKEDRMKAIENVYSQLEKDVGPGGKFLQKVKKPGLMKFNLKPTELASELKVEGAMKAVMQNETFSDIKDDVDIFSKEFEQELAKSIVDERSKNRKK